MIQLSRKPVVVVYVRHRATCPHREDESYPRCECAKWVRWSQNGTQRRRAAHTRTWGLAEEKAQEIQKCLDVGESATPVMQPSATQPSISAAIETFITGKLGEGVGAATIRKLRYQLSYFERFMAARSKFFPLDITAQDVIEYRASWTWKSGVTRQKAQDNLRGFLRSCCKANLAELLGALKTIRLSKADRERLKPQPFSEKEIQQLLAQVQKTFPAAVKARRVTTFIKCAVSTGLACRDMIQLERAQIATGWLKIERQKTGKPVQQKLDAALHQELLSVTNGNPRYVFWDGKSLPHSATGLWQADLRQLMEDAGLWIKGNLSHRFRDTAVDFWLGAGCSMNEIAAMLGDTVAIVEKHYADLASKRMEERLSRIPVRSWD